MKIALCHSGEASGSLTHGRTDLDDPSGGGGRTWWFSQNGAPTGSLTTLERYNSPGRVVAALDAFTWTQSPANRWYVGKSTSTADGTATKKTTQTLDANGNVTQVQLFNYGDLVNPARTYVNNYLTDTNYTSRYIRNRLTSSTLNGQTMVTNVYDLARCDGLPTYPYYVYGSITSSMTNARAA